MSRFPEWLKVKAPQGETVERVKGLIGDLHLHTVCQGACCPNQGECFARGTATFMILGDTCTRNCRFCAVNHGRVEPPDPGEPARVAEAAFRLGLKHAVVTSVTRDDLPDGGAGHFALTIAALRERLPDIVVEVLIPDFGGDTTALHTVVEAGPDILNHNVETVPRLYSGVRPQAVYSRSLDLLQQAKEMSGRGDMLTKSGLMVGLGELREEVLDVMRDLRQINCDLLTIGQYLSPTSRHHRVMEFVTPDMFREYGEAGRTLGFKGVASFPLARSSYRAELLAGEADRERL
ncbi:MAG: lipoyl synthase [bacterium]|nr:lipoyl synthase [bacterium]MDD3805215.1 lipoyl synthase [bacterium]MDD4152924.1 lipoyl synthase [bacterium]MDD4558624.1 lipoyl synthase [bacterium]